MPRRLSGAWDLRRTWHMTLTPRWTLRASTRRTVRPRMPAASSERTLRQHEAAEVPTFAASVAMLSEPSSWRYLRIFRSTLSIKRSIQKAKPYEMYDSIIGQIEGEKNTPFQV